MPLRHYFHLYYRIPDTDPYWKDKTPITRKECLHQQVTRAVPDWHCHLGPRQIVSTHQGFMELFRLGFLRVTCHSGLSALTKCHCEAVGLTLHFFI